MACACRWNPEREACLPKLREAKSAGMNQTWDMVTPPSFKFTATLLVSLLAFALVLVLPEELDSGVTSATVHAIRTR